MTLLRLLPVLSVNLVLACAQPPHQSPGYGRFPRMPPNHLAQRPPLGWSTAGRFGCDVNERLIRQMADAVVESGLREGGYEYLLIEDCWQAGRAPDGTLVADPLSFPSGIPALAHYLHARGLKLGVAGSAGDLTCRQRAGSLGHEEQDAATYAAWGVDYLRQGWCHAGGLDPREQYARMHDALARTGREVVLAICAGGMDEPWEWAPLGSNLWCTAADTMDDWDTLMRNLDATAPHAAVAGPGHWNDAGLLQVGNGGMTADEYRAQVALWAMMATPLMAGNDLRAMGDATRRLLLNADLLAVSQDAAGIPGARQVERSAGLEVWSRPLDQPGERAVLLFNRTASPVEMSVEWSEVGLSPGPTAVRDVWAGRDIGLLTGYTATVPSHGVVVLKLFGEEPLPPAGVSFASDLTLRHTANGLGPVERDQSNGGAAGGDGRPLTLVGRSYPKGFGVHAESSVRLWLGGRCFTFFADVGVDDEVGAGWGTAVFQLWADGQKLFDSGVMSAGEEPRIVEVDVTGLQELVLRVTGAGDTVQHDHADWAGARLVCRG